MGLGLGILPTPAGWPAAPAFPPSPSYGYDADDVDGFLVRLWECAIDSWEGRDEALRLIEGAKFPLRRRDGYLPASIDEYLDRCWEHLSAAHPQ